MAVPLPPAAVVVERLRAAGCVAAAGEARELLAAAQDGSVLAQWLARREQGEPLAWITGSMEFCGRRLYVAPGVYVPRVQTEELARRAAARLPQNGRAADLCTGAGAIAAHLLAEVPNATVVGVDVDPGAAACAEHNGVRVVVGDLEADLGLLASFDVVTAVPPYVPTGELRLLPADVQRHEPRIALDGGADGLGVARRVVMAARRLLMPGGWLLMEVGGNQDEAIAPHLATHGFRDLESWHDEDGDLRGVCARRTEPRRRLSRLRSRTER